jgi:aryl-alcohol dehydrogenase-like predicted oxidoreductase
VAKGKVLHVASSNVRAAQVEEADAVARARQVPPFCGTQIEWNLLNRDVEASVVPAARKAGLGSSPTSR